VTVTTCISDTRWSIALLLSTTLILSACDTSMTTGDAPQILSDPITLPTNTDSPVADLNGDTAVVVAAPTLTVAIDEYTLTFRWEPPVGSVTTRLLIHQPKTDSFDTLTTIEDNATRYTLKVAAHTLDWQTQYVLEHCDGNDCVRSLGTRLSNTESANTNPGSWLTSDNSKPYDALGKVMCKLRSSIYLPVPTIQPITVSVSAVRATQLLRALRQLSTALVRLAVWSRCIVVSMTSG